MSPTVGGIGGGVPGSGGAIQPKPVDAAAAAAAPSGPSDPIATGVRRGMSRGMNRKLGV